MENDELGRIAEKNGDMLLELGHDPMENYILAMSTYFTQNLEDDCLRLAKKIEKYGDYLKEKGKDPNFSYSIAMAIYSKYGNTGEFSRVREKLHSKLESKIDKLVKIYEKQLEEAKNAYKKEISSIEENTEKRIMLSLLDILDNFERSLKSDCNDENYKKGIEMIYKQFYSVLRENGLERFSSVGEMFDPKKHEAIGYKESKKEDNVVVDEFKPGYFFKGKLLRAAQVILSKKVSD